MSTTPTTPAVTPVAKPAGGMPLCSCRVTLDKAGFDVAVENATPAEILLLVAEHHGNAGGDPIKDLVEKGSATRTNAEEVARLKGKYAAAKVNAIFQGAMPNMPATFDEARKIGIGIVLPTNKLVNP